MEIPLRNVLSARDDLIQGGITHQCYLWFLDGETDKARERLIKLHFDTYFGPTRNMTTDAIVKDLYESKGCLKPRDYMNSDRDIVLKAVTKRVDEYLAQLQNFQQNGYVETTKIRMSQKGPNFIMRSCGENKIAALLALGYRSIQNVQVI